MRMTTSLLFLLTAAAFAADKPPVVKLEAPPRAEWQVIPAYPDLTTLAVETAGEWFLIDETNARLKAAADGKSAKFAATADAHYRLVVVCEKSVHRIELVRSFTPGPARSSGSTLVDMKPQEFQR